MSDDRTGRELTPRPDEEPSAVTPREAGPPATAPVERFSAGQQAHTVGLTEERAAQIVRSSGNARMVAFLAVLLVVIFIPIYWLFENGLSVVGLQGRLENEADRQYVQDVSRGYALFLANCARCHGQQGQGGIGPPLNDQGKLYQAVNGNPPIYTSGKGHLSIDYVTSVLEVGGRYVCGDPKSVMPVWEQPNGPLNYREVNDIVQFIVASNQTSWVYQPATGESLDTTAPPAVTVNGWRDPNYTPPPGATPVPACWRNPSGQIGGGGGAATPTPAAVASPGTPDSPRPIAVSETADLHLDDASGAVLAQISVVPGETVKFDLTNTAGFPHNFYLGAPDQLSTNATSGLPGVPEYPSGTQSFTWTVPTDLTGLQFACTVPGHYGTMHGDFVVAAGGAAGSPAPSGSAAPSATPGPSASTSAPAPSTTP